NNLEHDSNDLALLALRLVLGHCLLGVLDSWFHRAVGGDQLVVLRRARKTSHHERRDLIGSDREIDGCHTVQRVVRALDLDGDGRVHRVDQHEVLSAALLQELSFLRIDAKLLVFFLDLVSFYVGHLHGDDALLLHAFLFAPGTTLVVGRVDLGHFALFVVDLAHLALLIL
ncbi:hypothetical protein PMAYCL1PPCAC_28210, partial [Pristionchus mayeri]